MKTLSLATLAEHPNDVLELDAARFGALLERRKIIRVFGQAQPNHLAYEI